MKEYNKELDKLFIEWTEKSIANNHGSELSKDGILLKPNGCNVNQLWENSTKRIMFLLKDQPNGGGDDIRNWLVLPEDNKFAVKNRMCKGMFLNRLATLFYCLFNDRRDHWNVKKEDVVKCFNKEPFAFVEAKKQSGGTKISNKELSSFINIYKDELIKEINILEPKIIVCCGGPQYHFAIHDLYKFEELECVDNNIYYKKDDGTVILYAPHPSSRCSNYNYFEGVLFHYGKYLEE